MLKLIIVDDEETILSGMLTAVPWDAFQVQICGTARNGREACALLEKEAVDIVLTDISMPIMDGLELAKTIRQNWPHLHVIILTGYDEFDYAKRAIEYGVDAFLLKPVGIEELEEQLNRIRLKINAEQERERRLNSSEQLIFERSQALVDAFLIDLVYDKSMDVSYLQAQAEVLNLPAIEGEWQAVLIEIRATQDSLSSGSGIATSLLQYLLINILDDLFKPEPAFIAGRMDEYDLLLCLNCQSWDMEQYRERLLEFSQVAQSKLHSQLSIGVGKVVDGLQNISESFEEAADALQFRALNDASGLHFYRKAENGNQNAFIFPNEAAFQIVKEVMDHARSAKDKQSAEQAAVDAFFRHIGEQQVSVHRLREHSYKLYFILLENVGQSLFSSEQLADLQDRYSRSLSANLYVKEFASSIMALIAEINMQMQEIGTNSNMRIVQLSKAYIKEHYAEDISLAQVAGVVHLTPNYLSRIFKDLSGENFNEYINRYRIKKAVSLLQNSPEMKVYEVGEAVGLANYKYFVQVFKKYTGTSPTQFKR